MFWVIAVCFRSYRTVASDNPSKGRSGPVRGSRIVTLGSPDELKRTVAGDTVTLGTDAPAHTARLARALPGATGLAVDGATVRFRVPQASTALPALLRELDAAGIALESVEVHRPTLDDVFQRESA